MASQTSTGHIYSNTIVCDSARAVIGNMYQYADADLEEKRILDWLTPLDPSQSHGHACKQYQAGTRGNFF